ncbi:MAG: hypothetical protein EOM21_21655 [Gammaproteobacteria bacterium]|nr:hypothetical protein [Gammaproteobacteria bacterium]
MPGITLAIAAAKVDTWLAAEDAVCRLGQSFTTDTGRTLTRADLADIRDQIKFWQGYVERLQATAPGARRQRPVIVYDA